MMENKKRIPLPLNGKDIDADAILDALRDRDDGCTTYCYGCTNNYFTVHNALWCMVHFYNCQLFTITLVHCGDGGSMKQEIVRRLRGIERDLNTNNDDEYVRKMDLACCCNTQFLVSFYYEPKELTT